MKPTVIISSVVFGYHNLDTVIVEMKDSFGKIEWRNLRVTEESSKVLKVRQGGDLTMTAESRRRKEQPSTSRHHVITSPSLRVFKKSSEDSFIFFFFSLIALFFL